MTDLVETRPESRDLFAADPLPQGEETDPKGLTAFLKVFENISKDSRPEMVRGDPWHAHAVGIPTAMRHRDGGFDEDGHPDLRRALSSEQGGADSADGDPSEERASESQSLCWSPASLSSGGDRRVYVDCEAAGLPRKEIARLARVLHNSAIAGKRAISVSIHLPELGEMRFDVRIENKTVFLNAFVRTPRAATALALAISTLRDKLAEHDLCLGKLDVTTAQEDKKDGSRTRGREGEKTERHKREKNRSRSDRESTSRLGNENGVIHVLA